MRKEIQGSSAPGKKPPLESKTAEAQETTPPKESFLQPWQAVENVFKWALIIVAVLSPQARGEEVVFGPEFTFSSPLLIAGGLTNITDWRSLGNKVETNYIEKKKYQMTEYIEKNCKNCYWEYRYSKRKLTNVFRVTFEDGFWFEVGPDPLVIEVTAKPSTRAEFRRNKHRIEKWVFGAAKHVGLEPMNIVGGGHISVGQSSFNNRPLLFRNFIVDMANHPELAERARGSALTLSDSPEPQQAEFRRAIADFDAGKIKTMRGLAKRIRDTAYPEERVRYVAIALNYLAADPVEEHIPPEGRRVELRGFAAQRSMQEFMLQIELIEKRIKYLARKRSPIPVDIPGLRSDRQKRERFEAWVKEMGLPWHRFKDLPITAPWYTHLDPSVLCTKAMRALGKSLR